MATPFNRTAQARSSLHNLIQYRTKHARDTVTKKEQFKALLAAGQAKIRDWLNYENIEELKHKYYISKDWLLGAAVTESQEQARYLEVRLNANRKELKETRDRAEEVTEELRSIAMELEHTNRGDVKHLHLRQKEYETIQREMRLSKEVQKSEFAERETFTLLMNAVREHQETERDYSQQMKMVSVCATILASFVGYLLSARLNSWRFAKMEETLDKNLEKFSKTTITEMRSLHGIDPVVVVEEPKAPHLLVRLAYQLVDVITSQLSPSKEGPDDIWASQLAVKSVVESTAPVVESKARVVESTAPIVESTALVLPADRLTSTDPSECADHTIEISKLIKDHAYIIETLNSFKGIKESHQSTDQDHSDLLEISQLLDTQKSLLSALTSLKGISQLNQAELISHLTLLQNSIDNTTELYNGSINIIDRSNILNTITNLQTQLSAIESTLRAHIDNQHKVLENINEAVAASTESNTKYDNVNIQSTESLTNNIRNIMAQSADLEIIKDQITSLSAVVENVMKSADNTEQNIASVISLINSMLVEHAGSSERSSNIEIQLQDIVSILRSIHSEDSKSQLRDQGAILTNLHDATKDIERYLNILMRRVEDVYRLANRSAEIRGEMRREELKREEIKREESKLLPQTLTIEELHDRYSPLPSTFPTSDASLGDIASEGFPLDILSEEDNNILNNTESSRVPLINHTGTESISVNNDKSTAVAYSLFVVIFTIIVTFLGKDR